MRYVVTGGAGFIGSTIVRALVARGDAVTVVDDFSTGRESNLEGVSGDLEVLRGDVRDARVVARAVRGAQGVVHQAAVASVPASIADPVTCDEVNVGGTVRLLEEARRAGVQRFVLAASAAAYGDEPTLPKREEMLPRPLSPYAASKVAAEHYVDVYATLHGMRAVSLRYFNVYGPRQDPKSQYAAAIPLFVETLLRGAAPRIFDDGEQTRDFCYVDDVVDANLRALASDEARGQVVNVAGGTPITVNELVAAIGRIVGTDLTPTYAPARPGDIKHSVADVTRAKSLLGWTAQTPLDRGLQATVAYFRGAGA